MDPWAEIIPVCSKHPSSKHLAFSSPQTEPASLCFLCRGQCVLILLNYYWLDPAAVDRKLGKNIVRLLISLFGSKSADFLSVTLLECAGTSGMTAIGVAAWISSIRCFNGIWLGVFMSSLVSAWICSGYEYLVTSCSFVWTFIVKFLLGARLEYRAKSFSAACSSKL